VALDRGDGAGLAQATLADLAGIAATVRPWSPEVDRQCSRLTPPSTRPSGARRWPRTVQRRGAGRAWPRGRRAASGAWLVALLHRLRLRRQRRAARTEADAAGAASASTARTKLAGEQAIRASRLPRT
jgi:hypothetical protein